MPSIEKADKTLQAARVLSDGGFFDSAASRAYYAMFYIATAFLEGEQLSIISPLRRYR